MGEMSSVYSVYDVNNFLKLLNVNIEQILTIIHEEQDNLMCLKLALEIYKLLGKRDTDDSLQVVCRTILEKSNSRNISIVCDILKLIAEIDSNEQSQILEGILDFSRKEDLSVYLRLVSCFLKYGGTKESLGDFIVSLYKMVFTQNLKAVKNYFITDILKPFSLGNYVGKDMIFSEIITSFDLYTLSCIILEIPVTKFTDPFFIKLEHIIINKNAQWEYKLAVNILKSLIKSVKSQDFDTLTDIIKGNTESLIEFNHQWQSFFILIESSEEKQLHLVQPSLGLLKNIDKLAFIWIQCVYEKLLNHTQLSIVYSAASAILDFNLDSKHYKECIKSLLLGLNNNDYSEYAQTFFNKLENYTQEIDENLYYTLLEESAKVNWTPLSAWLFYSHCTKRLCLNILNLSQIECFKKILRNLEKLPHRYVRNGCFDLFYNKLNQNQCNITPDLLKYFESYNIKYSKVSNKSLTKEKDVNVEKDVKNSLENIVHVLLTRENYDNYTVSASYNDYNTRNDQVYSKNILERWISVIQTEKVSSELYVAFLTHLCFYLTNISERCITLEEIENILEIILSTQSDKVFETVFHNLTTLLAPLSQNQSRLQTTMFLFFKQLDCIKCYETRLKCTDFYFATFFKYYPINYENHPEWATMFNDVFQNEIKMFSCLKNVSTTSPWSFPYVLQAIYFGDCLTKEKRYEEEICYQIYLEKGLLNCDIQPSFETLIRLEGLKTCIEIITKYPQFINKFLNFSKKRYFPNSSDHIRYLRAMQVMMIVPKMDQLSQLFDTILENICTGNHQPSVRQLMQWMLILISLTDLKYFSILKNVLKNSESLSVSTSLIPILYHLTLKLAYNPYVEEVIDLLLEYTMGPTFKLRVYSQVAIFNLITHLNLQIEDKYTLLFNLLKTTIESNKDSINKMLNTDLEFFEDFDYNSCYHLRTILIDIPKINNVAESEWRYIDHYLKEYPEYEAILPMKKLDVRVTKRNFNRDASKVENMELCTMNIQKKIIPFHMLDPENDMIEFLRNDLVVIASLVTSAANLGGLARTCEIYGVKKLVVHNAKIIDDKEFKSLSMSSERWLNIVEVKKDNLIEYINGKKNNGYVVIGAEQTSDSVKLNEYTYPSKSILLLGNEKEGISFHLLPYLDVCIEIPQFGVVRSLNVHVAGSTFIWEYIKQRVL